MKSEWEGGVGAVEGAVASLTPLSSSTFKASWGDGAGFGRKGGTCTVGVVDWRLERARQEDAVRKRAGLARSGRRLRPAVIRRSGGREVAVRLPGRRQLHLTWLKTAAAATSCFGGFLLVLLVARVGDKLGGVERVGGDDLGFEVGGVSLWGGRGGVSRVVGGGGLVVPGQRGPIQTSRLVGRQQLSLRLLVLPAPPGLQASVVLLLLSPLREGQPVSKLHSHWLAPQQWTLSYWATDTTGGNILLHKELHYHTGKPHLSTTPDPSNYTCCNRAALHQVQHWYQCDKTELNYWRIPVLGQGLHL